MANADRPSAPLMDAPVSAPQVYLVGGGITSMAAAAFMIRDGDVFGRNITILEEGSKVGGSLSGAGSAEDGYVIRGGRALDSQFVCTFGLFASIPALDESETVTQETRRWSATGKTASTSCLFRDGRRETAPKIGLEEEHILAIERLVAEPESMLERMSIAEQFDATFFHTDFWFMWCTTFAFQPRHSAVEFRRSLLRYAPMIHGFGGLQSTIGTVYNQYDSLVRPLERWLRERGVKFEMNTRVIDLAFATNGVKKTVQRISLQRPGSEGDIAVSPGDYVLVTLGTVGEASNLGTMDAAPSPDRKWNGSAWTLWETITAVRPAFGRPLVFSDHVERSSLVSFTTTLHDPALLRLISGSTDSVFGAGGIITCPDSAWLVSIVIPQQPYIIGQPENVEVLWGYGLAVDQPGNFVDKPMAACSGREIMTEVLGHLGIKKEVAAILDSCVCIPSFIPFITSPYLPRELGDRPPVILNGSDNLAFMGQFCEVPDELVSTVEYSIRSAQLAVYGLLDLQLEPPCVYKGRFDPRVQLNAFRTLHDIAA